jgi:hypothetical protein
MPNPRYKNGTKACSPVPSLDFPKKLTWNAKFAMTYSTWAVSTYFNVIGVIGTLTYKLATAFGFLREARSVPSTAKGLHQ